MSRGEFIKYKIQLGTMRYGAVLLWRVKLLKKKELKNIF